MQVRLFIDYLSHVRRFSPHTITAYREDLSQFLAYCGLEGPEADFSKVTTKMIREWLVAEMRGDCRKALPGKRLNATTGRRKLSSIKAFFRFLVKEGVLEVNPAQSVSGPKTAKRLPVFVREEQMEEVLDGEKGEGFPFLRDHLILLTAYTAGMRRSEIVGLRLGDVDFSRQCIRVRGKGNKQREIPLVKELMADMHCYLEEREKLVGGSHNSFFVTDRGRPVYDQFIYRLVTRVLGEYTSLSKRSPHVLRHTFATHLLNNGAAIQGIRELLGHSSLAATQVYTHNSVENMLKIFKQAHPRA